MNTLYLDENYIIADDNANGRRYTFPRTNTYYDEEKDSFMIKRLSGTNELLIPHKEVGLWTDDLGTAFSVASLRLFLRLNTGFKLGGDGAPLTKTVVENLGFVDQTQTEQIAATAAANAALTPEKEAEITSNVSDQVSINLNQQGVITDPNLQSALVSDRENYKTEYNGSGGGTIFDESFSLQNDLDSVSFFVEFRSDQNNQGLGVIGEQNGNTTTIGRANNGLMYVRNIAGQWVSLNASISALPLNQEIQLKVEIAKNRADGSPDGIDIYLNGVYQKRQAFNNPLLVFDRAGTAYDNSNSFIGTIRNLVFNVSGETTEIKNLFYYGTTTGQLGQVQQEQSFLSSDRLSKTSNSALSDFFYKVELFPNDRTVRRKVTVFQKITSNYYIGFEIIKEVKTSTRHDYWRIAGGRGYNFVNGIMISNGEVPLTFNESEYVYMTVNQSTGARNADHTGGVHGDEKIIEAKLFASGKLIDTDQEKGLTEATSFYYAQKSSMHAFDASITDGSDGVIEAEHHKITRFENNGYKTFNRLILLENTPLAYIYTGISCVGKDCGQIVRNSYFESFTPSGDENFYLDRVGERFYYAENENTGLSATVESRIISPSNLDELALMRVHDRAINGDNDNKYYRRIDFAYNTSNPSVNVGVFQPAGSVYESEMVVRFDKKI